MRKRRRNNPIIAIVLSALLLVLITCILFWYFVDDMLMVRGSWQREIDITDEVVQIIEGYISDSISCSDAYSHVDIEDIKIISRLEITDDGKWIEKIDTDSYNEAVSKSSEQLCHIVEDVISQSLEDSSMEPQADINSLVKKAVAMELNEYLAVYGPRLVKDYEQLSAVLECEGEYDCKKNTITVHTLYDEKIYSYMVSQDKLVLDDGVISVYRRCE